MVLELYMSYTIHYVAADWTLQSRCLQTLYLPEALTGTLEDCGLDSSKQSCLATDNGSNICCAIYMLKWTHLRYFGHSLDLAIVNSMQDEPRINRAFGVCRKLVSAFSHSWKRKRELENTQLELGVPTHSLVSGCPT